MQTTTIFLVLVAMCCVSFFMGHKRSLVVATRLGSVATLHSLPKHYGYMVAAWAAIPALLVLCLWLGFESSILYKLVLSDLPEQVRSMPADELGLYYNQIQGFARGAIDSAQLDQTQISAATVYIEQRSSMGQLKAAMIFLIAIVGAILALRRVTPVLRARNHVENIIEWILFSCSFIAVLTTIVGVPEIST